MCLGDVIIKTISLYLKNWSSSNVYVNGILGGLLIGWSPHFNVLSSSYVHSSNSMKLKHTDYYFSFSTINIYGHYTKRVPFWEDLKYLSVFSDPLLVIGDLNFTLYLREMWRPNSREDPKRGFFLSFLVRKYG
jgi:hypothetical protein